MSQDPTGSVPSPESREPHEPRVFDETDESFEPVDPRREEYPAADAAGEEPAGDQRWGSTPPPPPGPD
ncbi:MAG TPA: hypothetical protein GX743_00695 [Actinomycetales bacterium]|nr:hypothetical protein [Actinomycetales bacterium]